MADPIQEVLHAFAHGELVVVTDDEDREGEGDLIVAASLCTADKMAFIIRHTSGIVCAPITGDDARRLRLDPMVARDGGVLLRSGHTEAAVDLCKLSGLPPVGVISELMNDDGTVMKGEQVARFAAAHKLKHVTIADMIAYRQAREKLIERVATFTTESPIGLLQGYAYRSPFDEIAHVAFVYNGVGDGKNVLTRFHKPNIVRDIFTGPKRMLTVLEHFKKAGSGVLVYLRDGAAGVPVAPLPQERSAEADRNRQWREVGVGAQILRDLGVTSIRHLTSSVHDYKGLSGFGIEIVSNEQLE